MKVKVYVEGGGDNKKALEIECRKGFRTFFEKSGLADRMPRIVRCGGRRQAYYRFRTAQETAGPDDFPVLLVDCETLVTKKSAWAHVADREGDGWQQPRDAIDDQLHLMVQAMEAWFHADKEALQQYYGQGFHAGALKKNEHIEDIPKTDLFDGLKRAARDTQNGEYSKGRHSVEILASIDPAKVRKASGFAERPLTVLDDKCG